MANTLTDIQKDIRFWQRLLLFGGYNPGKVDGVNGRKTQASTQEWMKDAERIKTEIGIFDERSERNIATLPPEAQRAAHIWLKAAKAIQLITESFILLVYPAHQSIHAPLSPPTNPTRTIPPFSSPLRIPTHPPTLLGYKKNSV